MTEVIDPEKCRANPSGCRRRAACDATSSAKHRTRRRDGAKGSCLAAAAVPFRRDAHFFLAKPLAAAAMAFFSSICFFLNSTSSS
eukprot:CAMPEP_0183545446 /NCGR_PEP_ID=MMETSP0371-20130417/51586_1 /TAXON_ID=268820 /ORGANISM="Peridinium aciculiferum, Strain PAER-2" /LENGTH=84 /DNA_ID=CAMNT_0025747609 /DNA_START=15 /DNA_END=265 /DNA_ORIENTATION=-